MSSHVLTERPNELRAPRRPATLWPAVTLPLCAVIVWAVNSGGEALRWLTLGGLASAMTLALFISLEAGLIAMMLFEPLRGVLSRAEYLFRHYSEGNFGSLVAPRVTILAFAMLLQRRRFAIFRGTPLAGMVSIL